VALALARQRLLTARSDFYKLRPVNAEDLQRNPTGTWLSAPAPKRQETAALQDASRGPEADAAAPAFGVRQPSGALSEGKFTFLCKTVPHITLKSIAQNVALDAIFAKHQPVLDEKLRALNQALRLVTPELRQKLRAKLLDK
jgi:adenine-specific DNA-methyltransferase